MVTSDKNFIHIINEKTKEETYQIQFDYGFQKIVIKKDSKITLDFVHGGFEEFFTREGNNLIIGDDAHFIGHERLGSGYGKEIWDVSLSKDTYIIEVSKYEWEGCNSGYADEPYFTETKSMSVDDFEFFKSKHDITINLGKNILYTTWPVLPNPEIYYHNNDYGDYAPADGKLTLIDYFKYGQKVYVGDRLLSDIIKNNPNYASMIDIKSNKKYDIVDTIFTDNLIGTERADKILSAYGDDFIEGKLGNDKITLKEGNKTVIINKGDGKDTIYDFHKADSLNIDFDTDDLSFSKSKNNLIINRKYETDTEQTVINNYFKNYDKGKDIIITNLGVNFSEDLTSDLLNGNKYLTINTKSKTIKGTNFSDEAFSSSKNEKFTLGKGNNIIHFKSDSDFSISPYSFGKDVVNLTKGEHLVLDFDGVGRNITCERKGNDAVLTSRYKIEIAGRDNGKEVWSIKKTKGGYNISKTEYYFTGNNYKENGKISQEFWTKEDLKNFQAQTGIKLKTGKNTLYTSWAVVPNPEKHYSKKDSANYGIFLGSVTLKNYFKYAEDSVYIGKRSLREFLNPEDIFAIDKSKANNPQNITDTSLSEVIKGSKYSDDIISNYGDDIIYAGKGNDSITLNEGEKTLYISKGEGKDFITIAPENTSTNIIFDDIDSLSFRKSGYNLIINREYDNVTENTVIRNYYKNNLENNINISCTYGLIWENLKDSTDIAWQIICKYPPMDDIPIAIEPEIKMEIICAYPPIDEVNYVSALNQEIACWQTPSDSICTTTNSPITEDNINQIFVMSES